MQDFTKLIQHHLNDHPTQIKTLLQTKKKPKRPVKPYTKRRSTHDDELNRLGVVNVRTAFNGDIIISRLRNPSPQDTDISVLFGNLRAQIKNIFKKFYSQKASFR